MKWSLVFPLALLGFGVGLAIITGLSHVVDVPDTSGSKSNPVLELVGMCLLSPLSETMALWIFFSILSRALPSKFSAIIAALILASLHALVWPYWPLVVAPVLIASSVPFMFENASSKLHATQSFAIHAINNLLAWSMAYVIFVD